MRIKIKSAYRLKADAGSSEQDKVRTDLRSAMSVLMGKGMQEIEQKDGPSRVIVSFKSMSTTQDVGSNDLARLERVMAESHSLLTIHCEGGKPVFSFEIEN
jgi:hypothetical protein